MTSPKTADTGNHSHISHSRIDRKQNHMTKKFTRVLAGVSTVAVASVGLISASAHALPPGTAPNGSATLSPATGNSGTTFSLLPPSGSVCPGDSATGGYRWQTFFVASATDPGTLTYNGSGPVAQGGAFTQPLFSSGTPVINKNTGVGDGLITGIPSFSNSLFTPGFVPAGSYNLGFACTLSGATVSYWTTPITVTTDAAGGPAQFDYSFGSTPSAPVLGALTPGDTTLSGSFTAAASTPATTGYTVTAHPTTGADVVQAVPAAGPLTFSFTGLTNGTSYAVSVIATNTTGNSPASNVQNGTPNLAARPGITNVTVSQIAGPGAHISFTAPTGTGPTSYTIAGGPAPVTVTAAATSGDVLGLTPGTPYTFTVTANYAVAPLTGPTASAAPFTYSAAIIIQDITAVRPAGALILTQRCGVNGALGAELATANGFPATAAVTASANQVGTAPTTGAAAGGPADPQFPAYPFPAPVSYPTHCAVNLGTGSYITTGALAGQYYSASGNINQVTVADNRDTGAGWTVNGTMGTFSNGSSTFTGSHLGWTPKMTLSSPGQTVVAGPAVDPSATTTNTGGLGTPRQLASAAAGVATGVANLDARLKLLIPVSAATGTFTGQLTLSAI